MPLVTRPKENTAQAILEAALANIQTFVALSHADLPNRDLIQRVVFEQIKDAIHKLKESEK